jgi:tetratricopeptide (TPR) repeat protein
MKLVIKKVTFAGKTSTTRQPIFSNMFWKVCIFLFLFLCPLYLKGQETPEKFLEVRGISELEMEPLARATINLYDGANKVKTIQSGPDGTFSFKLDINKQYTIEVEKEGLVSKRIVFNTTMPAEEKGTWMNEFSIGLIKPCTGVDYSLLKQPVDQVKFDAKRREYLSDKDYVNSMRPKMESLMIKTDQCMLDNYESLVKKADQTATQKNFDEAINIYREALKIYPSEEYPAKRIAELNSQINKQQFSEEAYKKLIAEADALSSQGNTAEALQRFKQAAALNPGEPYPKQKIADIEKNLAAQQAVKQSELSKEEKYNQAMAKASVAYTRKDYTVAKQLYQEALSIKPSESLPKSRVQEIETIIAKKVAEETSRAAEAGKKAEAEKEYLNLVAQADALFKEKKYNEAKALYTKASTMRPSESYPAQRVKVIQNAITNEQAALQKSKDEGYEAAMTAANNALAKNQFPLAKENFQKALTFKPEDAAAKSRIAEVDKLADAYAKQKSQAEQYTLHMQAGDALMGRKQYTEAKESFIKALTAKPGDKLAASRITAVESAVEADQAASLKVQNDQYNAAMAAGNYAIAKQQFEIAKSSYQKALSFKPDDVIAKSKIAETDRLSAEYTKQQAAQGQYAQIIQNADGLLASKELAKAREEYKKALVIKPSDAYAQGKISAIDNSIAAEQAAKQKNIEEGYKSALGAANTSIAQKAYPQAKEHLQKALALKPGDNFATTKVAEVDRLIEEQQKQLDQVKQFTRQYNEMIASADKLLNDKDYNGARTGYLKILQLKPGDTYASQKLTTVENLISAQLELKKKQSEEAYSKAMATGTSALATKNFSAAKASFSEALTIKPGDTNARQKLSETELLLRQDEERKLAEQGRKKKFDDVIRSADQLFSAKNYAGAQSAYELALTVVPGDAYARQRLDETQKLIDEQEKILAENRAKDNAYNQAIINADKYFRANDWVQSRGEYSRALTIKPSETLPKTRLAEIEKLILARDKEQADTKARLEAYTASINSGNALFARKEYANARNAYAEALKVMPGDALAAEQIKKIDYLIAEAEKMRKTEEAKRVAFQALIASADQSFDGAKYQVAKEEYKKALVIDPSSAHAKQRITRIDEITRILAQSPAKTNTQNTGGSTATKVIAAIPMKELNFKNESERQNYLDELKEKYPPGITLEKYKEQYKETYRYIVIRESQVQEYRHVKFLTYGGVQYSVNGKPITQQYFLSQTKLRAGETLNEMDMQ